MLEKLLHFIDDTVKFFKTFTWREFVLLLKGKGFSPEKASRRLLWVGILLGPITLVGALWGFIRAYHRILKKDKIAPRLYPLHPAAKRAMFIFGCVGFVITFGWAYVAAFFLEYAPSDLTSSRQFGYFLFDVWYSIGPRLVILLANAIISGLMLAAFNKWRQKESALYAELDKFGSAEWAKATDFDDLSYQGIYVGGGYTYHKQGHLVTIAGTRAGKFTNLIAPNLLGAGSYNGSWFVIDPKGEAAFVTGRYQQESGRSVYALDPWNMLGGGGSTFNPLDLISVDDPEKLADDANMMAYLIAPENPQAKDPYWDNAARSIISAFIMYTIIKHTQDIETDSTVKPVEKSLATVWKWLRLSEDDFSDLLHDMTECDNDIVKSLANGLASLKKNTDNAYGSVMSTAQIHTDFLKSPSLQNSISSSSLDISQLSNGKITVYVVIPPDKLESHGRWLALVTACALRSVIRNRNKRVTFILDEFPSLGKMKDVQTFMAVGAGYNITLWPIFQTLSQLTEYYPKSWETFLGNAAVKHFFGINENYTANYVSAMIGSMTYITYNKNNVGDLKAEASQRPLATPDEVRRGSGKNIFTFIENRKPTFFAKFPYYEMDVIKDRADPNPYYDESNI